MHPTRRVEIWVGLFVALGLLALFFVAMQVSNLSEFHTSRDSYRIKAHFGNIGGLRVRAPVSMAGVTIGRVERVTFDNERYDAVVEMRIEPEYSNLPEDTSASILTAGLLGEQYVGLSAGGSDEYLVDGSEIELTQSAMVLEQLISRFLFNKAEEGGSGQSGSAQASESAQPTIGLGPAPLDEPPSEIEKPVWSEESDRGSGSAVELPIRKAPRVTPLESRSRKGHQQRLRRYTKSPTTLRRHKTETQIRNKGCGSRGAESCRL